MANDDDKTPHSDDGKGPEKHDGSGGSNDAGNEVGYGKPPKAHQFKKGQTGNPKGRLKGSKNLRTELREEISETVVVREGGKLRKLSKLRAMLKSLSSKGLGGNVNAVNSVIDLVERLLPPEPENVPLDKDDMEILEAYLARLQKRRKPDPEPEPGGA
jgi:hypothetical protein